MKARVLLVEDEYIVAEDLSEQLQRGGHHVVSVCETGEAAVSLCDQHRPDIVIMDIVLPSGGMDGLQAARTIKRAHPGCAIALISGLDRGSASDFSFFSKPIDIDQLLVWIRSHLDAGQPQPAEEADQQMAP